jgi:hypothetical protein
MVNPGDTAHGRPRRSLGLTKIGPTGPFTRPFDLLARPSSALVSALRLRTTLMVLTEWAGTSAGQ